MEKEKVNSPKGGRALAVISNYTTALQSYSWQPQFVLQNKDKKWNVILSYCLLPAKRPNFL